MDVYIMVWLGLTFGYFFGSYNMDCQITYPNKLFTTVKLRGLSRKLFFFKVKSRVMKIALVLQIIGYVIFITGFLLNLICFFNERIRIEFMNTFASIAFVLMVVPCVYTLICLFLDKIFNLNNEKSIQKNKE